MPASSSPVLSPLPVLPSASPRRYLALWLPFLPTDRIHPGGTPDDGSFALVQKDKGALRITALNVRATGLGLRIGMALAQARALVPELVTGKADPATDALWHAQLAASCEMFTPLVALRGSDGLILDITGCAHLFGGERGLGQAVRRRLHRAGAQTQAAIADTPDAAWALARHRRGTIVPPGAGESLARALPIDALEQDSSKTIALTRAGFRTLGDLAERPSHLLTARFGEELVKVLRRVLGREDLRIIPLRVPPDVMAERHFPEPLATLPSLTEVLARLARDIMETLETRRLGGRAFEVSFFRADGALRRILVETAQATREAPSLMRLIRLKVEALADPLDPGFGFDALRLAVVRAEPLQAAQHTLAEEPAGTEAAQTPEDLVNRLVARFGRENVLRFAPGDTHDPVRAGGTIPCLSGAPCTPWPSPEPGHPPARPLTLFAHPQPIDVLAEVPDSPPLRFRWRRVLHEVTRAEGPERIAPEWWRVAAPAPATRDYYRVEDAGGHRFWIFREGLYEDTTARPRWFLHGLFA